VIATAIAYAAGITGATLLGSRLASFIGLLEVVFASLFAWLLLDERLTLLQAVGGALILGGIAAVRVEPASIEPGVATDPAINAAGDDVARGPEADPALVTG
jgi:drug/metabolite transporter (DMT)-like permease